MFRYVRNPVVTGNIPINRDISSLQHCKCTNDCISEVTLIFIITEVLNSAI